MNEREVLPLLRGEANGCSCWAKQMRARIDRPGQPVFQPFRNLHEALTHLDTLCVAARLLDKSEKLTNILGIQLERYQRPALVALQQVLIEGARRLCVGAEKLALLGCDVDQVRHRK